MSLIIKAVSVDSSFTTLYAADGQKLTFTSDAPEMKYISRVVLPELALKGEAVYEPEKATKKLYSLLSDGELALYRICKEMLSKVEDDKFLTEIKNVAQPLEQKNESTTVVAVTEDGAVPGIEQLDSYIQYSAQNQDFEGTRNLIKRMAKIALKRKHSVEDLLKFLSKADLPITPEGDIIAYKMLQITDDENIFVDEHTRKVKQRVGSLIQMDESMVDPDRTQSCSCGLHIASRGYLRYFHCPVCVLVKVKPEDVIAVPQDEITKVRVCAYQILCKLPDNCRQLLIYDKPITEDPEGQKLLTQAFNHEFDKVIETVKITKPMGEGLVISKVTKIKKPKTSKKVKKVEALDEQKELKTNRTQNIEIAKFLSNPRKALFTAFESGSMTKELAQAAEVWRKKRKKSWKALGLNDAQIITIKQFLK